MFCKTLGPRLRTQCFSCSRNYILRKKSTTFTSKTLNQTPFQYCLELVRKNDYENFIACILLPIPARESTIAVRAFNVSVAQIQDQVTQGTIGQMRMKFWHECLESVYDNHPPAQPIAIQLQKAVVQHKLTKQWLKRLVVSREENLNIKSFTSLSSAEDYAEHSVSPVLYLTLECLGVRSVHADHAVSHLGRAQGIVTLIRAIPFNSQRNRVMVPIELLIKHKVSQNDLLRGVTDTRVKDLVFDLASTANIHLEKAKNLMPQVPKEAKIALLPTVSVVSFLDRLRSADFNAFDSNLQTRNSLLPWLLWWNRFRKRY